MHDRVTIGSRTQPGCSFSEMRFGHVSELLPKGVWGGEPEMTDLIQAPRTSLTSRTLRDQQRSDRFHVPVTSFRKSRRAARQCSTSCFDRIHTVGLSEHPSGLAVRTINLDHHHAT
jgi:hypothetical protein